MMPTDDSPAVRQSDQINELRRRLDLLEDENQRLREKLEPLLGGPENPCFDSRKFQRLHQRVLMSLMLPIYLVPLIAIIPATGVRNWIPPMSVAGVPLFDFAGIGTRHPGIGFGVVS